MHLGKLDSIDVTSLSSHTYVMTPFTQRAIKDAVKAGFRDVFHGGSIDHVDRWGNPDIWWPNGKPDEVKANELGIARSRTTLHEIFLSPDFWIALGKARGWGWQCPKCGIRWSKNIKEKPPKKHHYGCDGFFQSGEWDNKGTFHWHRFIDHLAARKDPEQFFAQLYSLDTGI